MRSEFHQGQKRTRFNKRPDICTQLSFVARSNLILAMRGGPYMSQELRHPYTQPVRGITAASASARIGSRGACVAGAYPNDTVFWIDHRIGSRASVLIEALLGLAPYLFGYEREIKVDVNRLLTTLVALALRMRGE